MRSSMNYELEIRSAYFLAVSEACKERRTSDKKRTTGSPKFPSEGRTLKCCVRSTSLRHKKKERNKISQEDHKEKKKKKKKSVN